ncbi:lyase family protein [Pararhodobacter sp. CCB-MM2]|uniref:lyase family protein n=1 Tax=Pararhodobacter sp. CCB-MM2 TaxID=1786003 RepID=UPI00082BA5DF|nr:lyase family protein [Pararhodobacter sp. CCB-MM2]
MLDDRSLHDPAGTRAVVAAYFAPKAMLARIIRFEVALAQVQAELGLIPADAAEAITRAGAGWDPDPEAVATERAKVGHPMVAILEAFGNRIDPEGREWLHFGTTTADVFRTVTTQQLHEVAAQFDAALSAIGNRMAALARTHRATPMIGRTLGRHALPISFGYKVSVWLSELERDRARLADWRKRYAGAGVLSGAVGTHAAMGPLGRQVEAAVMERLGLAAPEPVDTKGALDIFAEFGALVAILVRGLQRVAQEVFLMQGDDIGELSIRNRAVGSSTMPHKVNPTLCIEIMSRAPEVSASLSVLLGWVVTMHERDSALHFGALEQMCTDAAQLLSCADGLLDRLVVHPEAMRANIDRTQGAIYTEAVTVALADRLGRRSAHELMREIVARMRKDGLTLAQALAADPRCEGVTLPDADSAMGEAPALVDACLERLGYRD